MASFILLKTRIITAAVLIALLLLVIFWLPPAAMVIAMTAMALVGGWEWSGFMRLPGPVPRLLYAAGIGLCLLLAWRLTQADSGRQALLAIAALWWSLALLWIVFAPRKVAVWSTALAGLLTLVPAWLAVVRLRLDLPDGTQWLLFLLLLVWVADAGAYFAGRWLGRHRLAPAVSPGKTWEGVAGALLASGLVALGGMRWFDLPLAPFLPLCLVVVAFSIVGDLTESLFKRHAGLKDSGTLFPGHGGVMDRIDSITSAAPVMLYGLLTLQVVSPLQRVVAP